MEVPLKTKLFAVMSVFCSFLFPGCEGSGDSTTGPTPSTVTQVSLVPLKVGDKWTVDVTDAEVTAGVETVVIVRDDSTYDGTPIYIGEIAITAPPFTSDGTKFNTFNGTGRIFLRKSDQLPVYLYESFLADVIPVGSTVSLKVNIIEESHSVLTGSIPATLTPGLSWTVTEVAVSHTESYVDGELQESKDSTKTKTSAYVTKGIYDITVPAGKFTAIEMDHTEAETGKSVVEYYSEEARVSVKETDTEVGESPSVYALRGLSLVK